MEHDSGAGAPDAPGEGRERREARLNAARAELHLNEAFTHGYGMTILRRVEGVEDQLTEDETSRLRWLMSGVSKSYHRLQAICRGE